ncbi:MAG: PAS domain S-box protein [bacterium]
MKQVEDGLPAQLFKTLLDRGSNAVYIVDAESGRVLEANEAAYEDLGWSRDELLDLKISDIEVNFSETLNWSDYVDEMREHPSMSLRGEHRRKDGSTFPVEVDSDLIEVDGREYVLAVVRNLPETEETREELVDHYAEYDYLFNHSPIALIELDLTDVKSYLEDLQSKQINDPFQLFEEDSDLIDECLTRTEIVRVNNQFLEVFKTDGVDVIRDNPRDFLMEETRETIKREILQQFDESVQRSKHCQVVNANGESRHLYIDHFPAPNQDEPLSRVFVTVVDVTERRRARRDLRETEQRYRTLFEKAKVGMAEVSLDEEWLRVNQRLQDILGYSESELLEMDSCADITHPDDLPRDREKAEKLIQGDIDHFSVEKRYRTKSGDYVWTQLTAGLVDPPGDEDPYMVSTIEDISNRKEAEQHLRESKKRFQQMADNIEDVFWLSEPDKEVIYVNSAFEEIWGVPAEDLYEDIGVFVDMIHPEDRDRVRDAIYNDQPTGDYDETFRIIRPDGEIRWIHDRAFPITDNEGTVVRIAGIAEDITERRRIRREREAFFDMSMDLFGIATKDGEFLEVNPAFEETLGYSSEEITDRPYIELVHPEDREDTRKQMQDLRNGESVGSFENRYQTKHGSYRWLSWWAIPDSDVVYAAARDVTERREYEKQLQTMLEEKEILLEEVHHRVKNNLQIISSLLTMQKRECDDQTLQRSLDESVNRVKSMAIIHENLYQTKNLNRIDFPQYLRDLADQLKELHEHSAGDINLEYDLNYSSLELEKAIPCGLILSELLMNALEHAFSDGDSCKITIYSRKYDTEGELIVEDNGQGLTEDFKAENSSSLGFNIVESLVEYELDGSLEIENRSGTRVKITFPV